MNEDVLVRDRDAGQRRRLARAMRASAAAACASVTSGRTSRKALSAAAPRCAPGRAAPARLRRLPLQRARRDSSASVACVQVVHTHSMTWAPGTGRPAAAGALALVGRALVAAVTTSSRRRCGASAARCAIGSMPVGVDRLHLLDQREDAVQLSSTRCFRIGHLDAGEVRRCGGLASRSGPWWRWSMQKCGVVCAA